MCLIGKQPIVYFLINQYISIFDSTMIIKILTVIHVVPTARLELAQLSPPPPQDGVSTNSTTSATKFLRNNVEMISINPIYYDYSGIRFAFDESSDSGISKTGGSVSSDSSSVVRAGEEGTSLDSITSPMRLITPASSVLLVEM